MRHRHAVAALSLWCLAGLAALPPTAGALELGLPLACRPGEDCWPVRLVDHDPGPGFADHRCGGVTADGHDGVDLAVRDPRRMDEGVPVIASAAGTVRGVRDGMPDQPPDGRLAHDYDDRQCGNGILLDHGEGWETQYCHLRRGSVAVRTGDRVEAGARLGLVGMSGEANFPHVHLAVRRGGAAIDPFTGAPASAACAADGGGTAPLWRADLLPALAYRPVPVAAVGLTDRVPEHGEIVSGAVADRPPRAGAPALLAYVLAYQLRAGDRVVLRVAGPAGEPVAEIPFAIEQDAPRATRSGGRRTPEGGWPAGTYRIEAVVERGGERWTTARPVEVAP